MAIDPQLRNIVAIVLGVNADHCTERAILADDLGADEIEITELALEIEDAYHLDTELDLKAGHMTLAELQAAVDAARQISRNPAQPR